MLTFCSNENVTNLGLTPCPSVVYDNFKSIAAEFPNFVTFPNTACDLLSQKNPTADCLETALCIISLLILAQGTQTPGCLFSQTKDDNKDVRFLFIYWKK